MSSQQHTAQPTLQPTLYPLFLSLFSHAKWSIGVIGVGERKISKKNILPPPYDPPMAPLCPKATATIGVEPPSLPARSPKRNSTKWNFAWGVRCACPSAAL